MLAGLIEASNHGVVAARLLRGVGATGLETTVRNDISVSRRANHKESQHARATGPID